MAVHLASALAFSVAASAVAILLLKLFEMVWATPKALEAFYLKQGVPSTGYTFLVGDLPHIRAGVKNDTPFQYIREAFAKHGRIFQIFLGPFHRISIGSAPFLQEVLVKKAHLYRKPDSIIGMLKPLLGEGLVTSEGDLWRTQRTLINPAFHFVNLKQMIGVMCACSVNSINKWFPSTARELEVHRAFSSLTLDIISATAFGSSFRDIPDAANIIYHAFTTCLDTIQVRALGLVGFLPFVRDLPLPSKQRIDGGVRDIQALVQKILDLRRSGENKSLCDGKDLLDLLLDARDDKGQAMDEKLIKDELMTFVLAGHETTSNLISWMAYRLCLHPELQRRCAEEVQSVLPNLATPSYDTLKRLHYLDAFMDETLRVHPPVAMIAREAAADHVLSGAKEDGSPWDIEVKEGTIVTISIAGIHRDPKVWANPDEFDPTRFLAQPVQSSTPSGSPEEAAGKDEDADMMKPRHAPCTFLPFAAGPRNCIGSQFAKLEAKVIMASILQRFSLEMLPGQKIVPHIAITVRPKYGLNVRFVPREVAAQ